MPPRRRTPPRPVESFDPRRPFTTAEAAQAGITRAALTGPAFQQLMRGVHVAADVPVTPALRASAPLVVSVPSAWASHASAGRLLGVPLPVLPVEHVSVLAASDRPHRAGVRAHVAAPSSRIVTIDGVRLSAPAQLFVELAEQLTLVDLVVVGDWLVRKGKVSIDRLCEFAGASTMRGAAAARAAVVFVRERVDSPMETRLRMLFVLAGFPEPEVNLSFDLGDGMRRYDLSWPGVKVVAEYDGRHHVEREAQWADDLLRAEEIDNDGWRRRTFIAGDVFNTPHRTLERMERLLRAVGLPGMPAVLSDAWRPHFPIKDGYL